METKSEPKVSDFLKQMENVIKAEFDHITFSKDGRSIVISVIDETDMSFTYSKGSKDDVTLAICQLVRAISRIDRVGFCEIFAEMLDIENAEYIYDSIKRRADFNSFDK